jgi:hypothetical protein
VTDEKTVEAKQSYFPPGNISECSLAGLNKLHIRKNTHNTNAYNLNRPMKMPFTEQITGKLDLNEPVHGQQWKWILLSTSPSPGLSAVNTF